MYWLILTLIVGVNFAPFLFHKIDIWHAQGLFCQILILAIFGYSLFEKAKRSLPNKPLCLMFGWLTAMTMYRVYSAMGKKLHIQLVHLFMQQKFYAKDVQDLAIALHDIMKIIYLLAPIVNFLCIIILYKAITSYITKEQVEKIMLYMRGIYIFTLFICVLQVLGLSQFFALVQPDHRYHNNLVTGLLGNGTHLSGFFAMCSPLLLWKWNRMDKLALVLTFLVLCFCGTTVNDPSVSGFLIIPALFLFFYKTKTRIVIPIIIIGIVGIIILVSNYPHLLSENGRQVVFTHYFPLFKKYAVIGAGPGAMNVVSRSNPFSLRTVRHIHFEYYHFAIELGLIGLFFILNIIHRFFSSIAKDRLQLVLKTVVLGFLLSCCFNYPAHLWLPSVWITFIYASFMILKGDRNECQLKARD